MGAGKTGASPGGGAAITGPGRAGLYPTPSGKLVLDVLHGRYLFYLEGGVNLVDINDAAEGHLLAMDKGRIGESYNLGNNENNISLKDLFSLIGEIAGVAAPRLKYLMPRRWPTQTFH